MMKGKAWITARRDLIYFGLVSVFLFGLACSKLAMSVSFICYLLFFLLFGDYRLFRDRCYQNRGWIYCLLSLFALHSLSFFWTSDVSAGWNALRVRLSFFILPILIATTFKWDEVRLIQLLKGMFVLLSALMVLNFIRYVTLLNQQAVLDIRQLSWFGSHIRFGILIAFSAALCIHLLWKQQIDKQFAWFYLVLSTFYVVYSQTFSAVGSLLLVLLLYWAISLRANRLSRTVFVASMVAGTVLIALIARNFLQPLVVCGNFQDPSQVSLIWEKKSSLPFFGKDRKGQLLQRTCERYLCSLGKPLTAQELKRLSKESVNNIENGFTDRHVARGGILGRYHELKYQYHLAKDPNGHSLLQRIAYWQTALKIIAENPIFGVGIGDIDLSLKQEYARTALLPEFQKRPHNMFLTTWLCCGVFGVIILALLLGSFIYDGVRNRVWINVILMLILCFSMLLEDSLETQAGASFAGLFLGLIGSKEAIPMWSLKNV